MMLPEEILHVVVEHLVWNPANIKPQLVELHWRHSRTGLSSLSLVSRQLRRICMPFLFAYMEVRGAYGELEKLRDQCAANASFAFSIRTLDYYCYSSEQIDTIHHLLHRLTNLSQFILNEGVSVDIPLLDVISQHTVQKVIIASWKSLSSSYLGQLGPSSLSKVTLDNTKLYDKGIEHALTDHLHYGMQIRCLTVHPNLLAPVPHNSLSTCKFSGLSELELWLNMSSEISWLPDFISAHPLLKRIRFSVSRSHWYTNRVVPFILPFLNAIDEEGLNDTMELKAFSVARNSTATAFHTSATPSTESLPGWHVAGLWFCCLKWSSGRLLQLAHHLFPQISVLSIEAPLPSTDCAFMDADEFVKSLCQFLSLRTVNLIYLYRALNLGSQRPIFSDTTVRKEYHGHLGIRGSHVQANQAAEIEAALVCFTSCIAKRMPTIEKFLIQEPPLRGCIHVNLGGSSGTLRSLMQSEMNQLFSLYV